MLCPFCFKWFIMTLADHGIRQISKLKVTKNKNNRKTPNDLSRDRFGKTLGCSKNCQQDYKIESL